MVNPADRNRVSLSPGREMKPVAHRPSFSWRLPVFIMFLLLAVGGPCGADDGCGLPARVEGIDVESVCSRLEISYRQIYGPDRSPWIAIDDASDCDRVRAELDRLLSSPAQETVPPELPPATDPHSSDLVQELSQQANALAAQGEFAAAAQVVSEQILRLVMSDKEAHAWACSWCAELYEKAGDNDSANLYSLAAWDLAAKSGNAEAAARYQRKHDDFVSRRFARLRREEEQRKKEAEKRAQDIGKLRAEMKPTVTDGPAAGFGLKAEFKPLGQDYPAPRTAWEQVLCAAYLSDMARQAGSAEDARFYAEQAASVMAGGRIHVDWRPPKVSPAQMRKIEEMGRKIAGNTEEVRALTPRIVQAGEQARTAEIRKNEVTLRRDVSRQKVESARQSAHGAAPERKQEADHLLALAEHELHVAENQLVQADHELNAAKLEEQNLAGQQKELEAEIRKLEEQMRQEAQR